jgi:hypothetical protein
MVIYMALDRHLALPGPKTHYDHVLAHMLYNNILEGIS